MDDDDHDDGDALYYHCSCRLNCLQKIASTSILSLRAECLSCTFDELSTITYAWNVFEFNMISKARTELPGWKERMESGK